MRTIWAGALTVWIALGVAPCVGVTQAAEPAAMEPPHEVSAQARRRPPTRIIVTPRRYGYPGPGAVRHCNSWLEPEARPSGTVIVPRMQCWWVPG